MASLPEAKAQDKVEKSGGKVVVCSVSSGSGKSLVNHKGYDASKWKEAVPGLKAELGLTDAETDALRNADMREEGQAMHYREVQEGNKTTATITAYHIVKRDDKINIIYGKHEESMEVSGAATSLPSENCIQYDGRTFAVLPPASPHSNVRGDDMKGLVVEIPSGWQLVQSSKQDFNPTITTRVVAPYGWHTGGLVTEGKEGMLDGWRTSLWGSDAGKWRGAVPTDWIERLDSTRFHIKSTSWRLLIEAKPSASPELVNNWKRFVQLSAQREWAQRLGMGMAGAIEA